jgi:hypothetical protein
MDATVLTTGLAAARGTIDLIKASIDIAKTLDKSDLIQKLIDAQLGTMELIGKLSITMDENFELKEKIKSLENEINDLGSIEIYYQVYWKRLRNGTIDGPFDPSEYDKKKLLVRLLAYNVGKFGSSTEECVAYETASKIDKKHYTVPLLFLNGNGFNQTNLPESR